MFFLGNNPYVMRVTSDQIGPEPSTYALRTWFSLPDAIAVSYARGIFLNTIILLISAHFVPIAGAVVRALA
jgi:hypothetical protein